MTGYGYGETVTSTGKVVVEVKGVNHRFSDVVIRVPRSFNCYEDTLRRLVQASSTRGRVEVYLSVEDSGNKNFTVKVDKELGMAYYKALEELRGHLGIVAPISLDNVVMQNGVLALSEIQGEVSEMGPFIEAAAKAALTEFLKAREDEGINLAKDICERVQRLKEISKFIAVEAPRVVTFYREKVTERLKEFSDIIEPLRLTSEVALLAERADITEELVRINSHLDRAEEVFKHQEPAGRRLDFLLQEIFREINTIGAKAQNLNISRLVVDAKVEIEKLREQVQNLE
jgi:uncharacterized protein (TIGR00255 family)